MIKLSRNNHHYVSQSYLKAWGDGRKNIWSYQKLVSHDSVRNWSQEPIKSIAMHRHLFTRIVDGAESDDIEIWMDQEIETPAQIALSKIRSNNTLTPDEWDRFLCYVALHAVRTPANYIDSVNRWHSEVPGIIKEVLKSTVRKMEAGRDKQKILRYEAHRDSRLIPMKVTKERIKSGAKQGILKTEVILGRGLWFFSIRHILTETYKILQNHSWSIIKAPEGMQWLTSDNPVVRLNYYSPGYYDFKGGWGNEGSEILFPLSPELLLYTQVGRKIKLNDISNGMAELLNQFIVENAHRYIFAEQPIEDVAGMVPRVVDNEAYRKEKLEWEDWHLRHKELEMNLQEPEDSGERDK